MASVTRGARLVRRVALRADSPSVTAAVFGFGAPVRREAALSAGSRSVVAHRAQAPDLEGRAFDRPVALRRFFSRPEGPAFLTVGTPEAQLLDLLAAGSWADAVQIARALLATTLTKDQRAFCEEVRGLALGGGPAPQGWGEADTMDALRLRLLAAPGIEPGALFPEIEWSGFLRWAGPHLGLPGLRDLPPPLLRPAIAAIVCDRGARKAWETLLQCAPAPWNEAELRGLASLLALRCALEGVFLPPMLQALLPRGRQPKLPADRAPRWRHAVFAWEAYRAGGPVAGFVHLTAALVSADLRARLRQLLGGEHAAVLPRVLSVLRSGTS
ncbi:MAG: hypothetical protein ACREBE_10110, partial [bacterium]